MREPDPSEADLTGAEAGLPAAAEPPPRPGFRRLMGTLARTARLAVDASPREAILLGLLFTVGALMPTAQLHLSKVFVDQAFGYAHTGARTALGVSTAALVTIGLITVVGVIYAAVNTVANSRSEVFVEIVTARVTQELYARVATMDVAYHDDTRWHDALARATEGVTYRPRQLVMNATLILGSAVGAIGMLGLVASLNKWLVVIVLLPAVFNVLIQRRVTKARFAFYYDAAERNREQQYIATLLTDTSNARDVRAYELAPLMVQRYTSLRLVGLRLLRDILRRVTRVSLASGLATGLATGVIYLILAGPSRTTPGAFTAVIGAVASLNMQVLILAMRLHDLDEQAVFLHDVQQFLDLPPLLHVRQPPVPVPDLRTATVRFEDVEFTYPTGHEPALEGFSLELRPGELLAIVGDNGGGKSTMVKLLLRFYDPQEGRITVGGVDLRDLDPVAWRRELGVLFQDYARLQLTVRDAVQAGRPWEQLSDDDVLAALRSAQAEDVMLDLPNGLDSRVGNLFPGGHELSGGQWQRLALARLVARDASIWVLDEPTSALDPEAEAAVFAELPALLHGRIGVIISHRFSTVRNADRIAVIRHGRVAELGSHEELMEQEGEYAGLFRLQAAGYV